MFRSDGRRYYPCPDDICYLNPMAGEIYMTDKQISTEL